MIADRSALSAGALSAGARPAGAQSGSVLSVQPASACARPCRWGEHTLGGGSPLIASATTAPQPGEAAEQARAAVQAGAQLVEIRADLLGTPAGREIATWRDACSQVRSLTADPLNSGVHPPALLLTVRTHAEGGAWQGSDSQYSALLQEFLEHTGTGTEPVCHAVDVEDSRQGADRLIETAHAQGVDAVASRHYVSDTPSLNEMLEVLESMEARGADAAKLAVMPRSMSDVARLLEATAQARERMSIPIITMAMGAAGVVSRLSGHCFGSALSFARPPGGAASAPGQPTISTVAAAHQLLTP